MDKIKEYKNKFPFGLEEFTKALSNNTRLAIASLLYEKGPLSYEEILKHLDKSELKSELKIMCNYGVVGRTNSKFVDGMFASDYKLNKIYEKVIKIFIDTFKIRSLEKIK